MSRLAQAGASKIQSPAWVNSSARATAAARSATRSVCGVTGARTLQEITQARRCQKVALSDAAPRAQFAVAQARSSQGYASNQVKVRAGR